MEALGTGEKYVIIDRGHKYHGEAVVIVGSFRAIWGGADPWRNPSYMLISEFLCSKERAPYTQLETSGGHYYYGILTHGFGTVVAPEWVI
jgi:hypothetical protein